MPPFQRPRWQDLSIVPLTLVPAVVLGLAVWVVAVVLDLPGWAAPPAVVLVMGATVWTSLHFRVRRPLLVAQAWITRRVDGDATAMRRRGYRSPRAMNRVGWRHRSMN